jgi:hypothetical protein
MPQTAAGKTVMARFIKQYGKAGKGYFYGKAVKSAKFAKTMGEMSVHNRAVK